MSELYFLRHGQRIDHALADDPDATPLLADSQPYDPSLVASATSQITQVAADIAASTGAFTAAPDAGPARKNVFIHFSPYLRCCQSADLLITDLKAIFSEKFPHYKVRFQLLGDFALSEWIHDRMREKPPYIDSNDAYNMYTPNIKGLKNKSACSNFRPTTSLGPFNGPDLSYKDYQARCKTYFQKLLATYDKPAYMKNQDIVIVISHGYVINNFISYFINHPIFDEIPEAKINYAKRINIDDSGSSPDEDFNPEHYTWKLLKDSLDMFVHEDVDTTLNLENDVVYYQTNFIKRDELKDSESKSLKLPSFENPRPSFKIESTKENHQNPQIIRNYNPLCSSAKDWTPQKVKHFKIKADFKLKVMNDESFKKTFSLNNRPIKPISPEVSPNSEPTRSNSVIDLTKLLGNDDIYKPMKLKYSSASEVPIHTLNSKVNSQVNLAHALRSAGSSNDSSSVDLPKYVANLTNRRRSTSNPGVYMAHSAKDSYFPSGVSKVKSLGSDYSLDSYSMGENEDLHIIKEHHNEPLQLTKSADSSSERAPQPKVPIPAPAPLVGDLSRSRSLNYHRTGSKSLLAKYQKAHEQKDSDESDDNMQNRMFMFSLNNKSAEENKKNIGSASPPINRNRSRKNSIKFIPSFQDRAASNSASPGEDSSKLRSVEKRNRSIFYHLNSDDSNSDDSSDDEQSEPANEKKKKEQYIWFGQNRN